jgi:hypothetical protein
VWYFQVSFLDLFSEVSESVPCKREVTAEPVAIAAAKNLSYIFAIIVIRL